MKVEELSLSTIKPYAKNPRKNDGAVKGVAESIKQFGFQQPIVIDKNNVIVVGHTRCKAAQQLGLEKVPCGIDFSCRVLLYREFFSTLIRFF